MSCDVRLWPLLDVHHGSPRTRKAEKSEQMFYTFISKHIPGCVSSIRGHIHAHRSLKSTGHCKVRLSQDMEKFIATRDTGLPLMEEKENMLSWLLALSTASKM